MTNIIYLFNHLIMLFFNISRILRLRKIQRPFSYLVKQGLSDNYATRIANSNIRNINLERLEELCLLFNCTPNDLLQWSPSHKEKNPESLALAALWRKEKLDEMKDLYESLPLEKLIEIEALVKENLKKDQ